MCEHAYGAGLCPECNSLGESQNQKWNHFSKRELIAARVLEKLIEVRGMQMSMYTQDQIAMDAVKITDDLFEALK